MDLEKISITKLNWCMPCFFFHGIADFLSRVENYGGNEDGYNSIKWSLKCESSSQSEASQVGDQTCLLRKCAEASKVEGGRR